MRIQLSTNFYLDEFTFSKTAIRHGIAIIVKEGSPEFKRLKRFAETIAQPLRDACGRIDVSSGYRPLLVNQLIGSSDNSQHIKALAGDLKPRDVTPLELCQKAIELKLPFDQLIYEFGYWSHISIAKEHDWTRGEVLTSYKFIPRVGKPETRYVNGLHDVTQLQARHNGTD